MAGVAASLQDPGGISLLSPVEQASRELFARLKPQLQAVIGLSGAKRTVRHGLRGIVKPEGPGGRSDVPPDTLNRRADVELRPQALTWAQVQLLK